MTFSENYLNNVIELNKRTLAVNSPVLNVVVVSDAATMPTDAIATINNAIRYLATSFKSIPPKKLDHLLWINMYLFLM